MLPFARFVFDHLRDPVEQIAEFLREQIVNFSLPPGKRITRSGVARQLGVSPGHAGPALLQLIGEGLLECHPTALVVRPIDLAGARQARLVRLAVELDIARRLSAAPTVKLDLLRALVDMQRSCMAADDIDGLVRAGQLFNRTLYGACGLAERWDDSAARRTHLDRLVPLQLGLRAKAEALIRTQEDLIDAIYARNPARAVAAVRARLDLLLADIGQLRARHPAWIAEDDAVPEQYLHPSATARRASPTANLVYCSVE